MIFECDRSGSLQPATRAIRHQFHQFDAIFVDGGDPAVALPHAAPHERPIEVYAPYVAEMVRQEMVAKFGGDVLTKGYHVTTTIDPVLQTAADQAIRDGLETYDHRHGWHGPEKQVELQPGETDASLLAHMAGGMERRDFRPMAGLAALCRN